MTFKHASSYFNTFNKLLICKAHRADPRTGTALYKNILLFILQKPQDTDFRKNTHLLKLNHISNISHPFGSSPIKS